MIQSRRFHIKDAEWVQPSQCPPIHDMPSAALGLDRKCKLITSGPSSEEFPGLGAASRREHFGCAGPSHRTWTVMNGEYRGRSQAVALCFNVTIKP
jgi:hypothetical protein